MLQNIKKSTEMCIIGVYYYTAYQIQNMFNLNDEGPTSY